MRSGELTTLPVEALNYTYDFEAINVYKQYKRTYSMFANSDFAAQGLPTPGELALLEPFRAQLPPDNQRLAELCKEYGFTTLMKELDRKSVV